METNQNPAQEQPVQPMSPQTTQAAQQPDIEQIVAPAMEPAQPAAQSTAQPAPAPQSQPGQPDELLYDPDETAQMIRHLTDGYFDPGIYPAVRKAGRRHAPQRCRGLRPADGRARNAGIRLDSGETHPAVQDARTRYRKIAYINPYILPLNYVESHRDAVPLLRPCRGRTIAIAATTTGFRRPKHPIDFAKAYADAKFHFDTFRTLGNELLEQAQDAFARGPQCASGGTVLGAGDRSISTTRSTTSITVMEFDSHDPVVMHDRMRTLSTKLMLVPSTTTISKTSSRCHA